MRTRKKRLSPVEKFFDEWLSHTTCGYVGRGLRSIFWTSKDGRYAILKHQGHTEYCGRGSGNHWCGTYYRLYDVTQPQPKHMFGRPALYCVDGRWSQKHMTLVKAIIAGIKQ